MSFFYAAAVLVTVVRATADSSISISEVVSPSASPKSVIEIGHRILTTEGITMTFLCQLCTEPLPPKEEKEASDLIIKFRAQLRDNDGGQVEEADERLTASLVCVQCLGCLEGAVVKREEVDEVEEQVRKLQAEVVKLMRGLKRLLGDYAVELRRVRERLGGGQEEVKLEDPLRMEVIKAMEQLSDIREDVNRKTVFEKPAVPKPSPPPEHLTVECEWEDEDVEPPEDQDDAEEEDEWLPSRSVSPKNGKRVTSDSDNDDHPAEEQDLEETEGQEESISTRQTGKRGRGRPRKVSREVDSSFPPSAFPPKYKPSWLTHPKWSKKGRDGPRVRRTLNCQTCPNYSTEHQYEFEGHLRHHEHQLSTTPGETEPRPCPHCSLTFLHPQMWEWHVLSHEGQVKNRCDLCAKFFPCTSMSRHLTQDHGVKHVISCPSCSCVAPTADKYLEHLRVHKNEGDSQACYLCPSRFGTRKELLQHLHDEHQALPKLSCSEPGCGQEFLDTHNLRHHEACHKATFACLECSKVFKHKHAYQMHLEWAHRGKRWTCSQCGAQLKTESGLKSHEKSHEITDQPWQCPQCPKKFKHEISLQRHQRLHEGQGFVCDQCGSSFTTPTILKNHVKYVHQMTEEEKVQCDLCGSRFKTKDLLKRHLKKHAEGRQWECDTCHKKFQTEKALENHRTSRHTGEKPHVCAVCGKAFGHPGSLRDHRRLAHGIQRGGVAPART